MKLFVNVFEMLVSDVGIDLSRSNVRMTEQGLNRTDVSTIAEQVRRERVTDDVRGNFFRDASLDRVVLHDTLH